MCVCIYAIVSLSLAVGYALLCSTYVDTHARTSSGEGGGGDIALVTIVSRAN